MCSLSNTSHSFEVITGRLVVLASVSVDITVLLSCSLLGLFVGPSLGVLAHLLLFVIDDEVSSVALRFRARLLLSGLLLATTSALALLSSVAVAISVSSGGCGDFAIGGFRGCHAVGSGVDLGSGRSRSEVASSPVAEASFLSGGAWASRGSVPALGFLVDGLHFLLGGGGLRASHFFVGFFVLLFKLSGAAVTLTAHLSAHHLRESAALLGHLEGSLGFLGFLSGEGFLHDLDTGHWEGALRVGLPLGEVELFKSFGAREDLLAAA